MGRERERGHGGVPVVGERLVASAGGLAGRRELRLVGFFCLFYCLGCFQDGARGEGDEGFGRGP